METLFPHKLAAALHLFKRNNAFFIQNKFYSYGDLAAYAAHIQGILQHQYAGEQRIGILISDNIETYAAIVAILLSGKTYVPIHPGHPADRIAQIIEQAGLHIILSATDADQYHGLTNIFLPAVIAQEPTAEITLCTEAVQHKEAYLLFTSGSTGTPKGTPISYSNLDSFITAFGDLGYKLTDKDRFLQMFELTFDLSVMSYLVPLCLGACVYTVPEKGMKYTSIYSILEEHDITFALMVPSILSYLRPYFSEIALPSLRYSLFCGEALLTEIVNEWAACAPAAVIENVYGPTEATIFCLTYPVSPAAGILDEHGIVAIGKPMGGVEAIIANEHNNEVPNGQKGELCLHGAQVTAGYLDSEKTREAFFMLQGKRYYRTGDIAYMHSSGNFIYCGRIDNQVKIQGFRVELSEIEHHIRASLNGCNAVAMAIVNESTGLNYIDAVIEAESVAVEELMQQLKNKLPGYMMPSGIHCINPFPLNVNGKIDRKALKKLVTELI